MNSNGPQGGVRPSANSVARNTSINVVGTLIPAAAAIVIFPLLARSLPPAVFGAFVLLLTCSVYFATFDVGVGRAVSQAIASASSFDNAARGALRVGFLFALVTGCGGLILGLCVLPSVLSNLSAMPTLSKELAGAGMALPLMIPAITLGSLAVGVLEAQGRFIAVNAVSSSAAIGMQAIPLAVSQVTHNLTMLALGIAVPRLLGTLVLLSLVTGYAFGPSDRYPALSIMKYGGWVTVAGLVSPLLTVVDRLLVGSLRSLTVAGAYGAAAEPLLRFGQFGQALGRSVFPQMASADLVGAQITVSKYRRSFAQLLIIGGPCGASIIPWLVPLWLGDSIGPTAAPLASILYVGAIANIIAALPAYYLLARRQPRTIALIYLVEALPYAILLYFATVMFGALGAATATAGRLLADMLLLNSATRSFKVTHCVNRFEVAAISVTAGVVGVQFAVVY